jgi:hypothetical protein
VARGAGFAAVEVEREGYRAGRLNDGLPGAGGRT